MLKQIMRRSRREIRLVLHRLRNLRKEYFKCPICQYYGPFLDVTPSTGFRRHAECPRCGAKERHRIQYLVFERLREKIPFDQFRMLHFAPEAFLKEHFRTCVGVYETADAKMKGVDHKADLRSLPFPDGSFDLVYASHVLEHIDDDLAALGEIRRILTERGIAILPVPVVADKTVEYPEPNPYEEDHVRAPGKDYFDRYLSFFGKMDLYGSSDCPEEFQCWTYEDRSGWPTPEMPLRPAAAGLKHEGFVPICFVNADSAVNLLARDRHNPTQALRG